MSHEDRYKINIILADGEDRQDGRLGPKGSTTANKADLKVTQVGTNGRCKNLRWH
jgi:hypothetical protein